MRSDALQLGNYKIQILRKAVEDAYEIAKKCCASLELLENSLGTAILRLNEKPKKSKAHDKALSNLKGKYLQN